MPHAMFRTPVEIPPPVDRLSLSDSLFFVGSCFAQSIGERFLQSKFDTYINPFGTLYNPASVFRLLHDALNQSMPSEDTYVVNQGVHYNYQFHSEFSSNSRAELQAQIEQTLTSVRTYLNKCNWLVITLGSAFGYELRENGQVVSNCHKMPAENFQRRLLDHDEITMRFEQFFRALEVHNPELKLILTVSPVRHLRDTLVQNSVSKATLRVATHTLAEAHPEKICYFPSYELLMDDLRDYRFYKADMLHPTEVAQDYIWQKLTDHYLDEEAQEFLKTWVPLRKAIHHRAFHPTSDAHQQFLRKTIGQLQDLQNKINVQAEIEQLQQQLL